MNYQIQNSVAKPSAAVHHDANVAVGHLEQWGIGWNDSLCPKLNSLEFLPDFAFLDLFGTLLPFML